ncbi:MAG: hypothetical protein FWC93_03430, partial [Defluviitaleaceae bacterium]|nr:hypothetical protein [Defluviitaleaceae bacterium]
MGHITKKQFARVVSVLLAMLMIFGSVPVDLYAGTIGSVIEDSAPEYEDTYAADLVHYEEETEYDPYADAVYYEYEYDYDESIIQWHSFSGYVMSEDYDTPLYGAAVSLYFEGHLHARVFTDYQGRFYLEARPFNLDNLDGWALTAGYEGFYAEYAWLEEYIDEVFAIADGIIPVTINFYLEEIVEVDWDGSLVISGIVASYESTLPIAGANVRLLGSEGEVFTAQTDAYGVYEIFIVSDDAYDPIDLGSLLLGATIMASHAGYRTQIVDMDDYIGYIDAYGGLAVNFELVPAPYIPAGMALAHGTVTLGYGEIVEGARVVFMPNDIFADEDDFIIAYTDADGRYSILLPASEAEEFAAWATYYIEETTAVLDAFGNMLFDEYGEIITETTTLFATSGMVELVIAAGEAAELDFELEWVHARATSTPIGIYTWADLNAFFSGFMGTNFDNFYLGDNITVPAGNARSGRGYVGGFPFLGTFDGRGHSITDLRLRPLTADERTAALTMGGFDVNDFGFIRVLGDGAVIENINFVNAHYTEAAGFAAWNTATGNIGLVAGRVAPGATATIRNVDVITTGTAEGTRSQISITGTRTVTNKRIGGVVGHTGLGSVLNIINTNVNYTLNFASTGPIPSVGGMIGFASGVVNISSGSNDPAVRNTVVMAQLGGAVRQNIGGVIGVATGALDIRNLNVSGAITGALNAGGVVGNSLFAGAGSVHITNVDRVAGNITGGGGDATGVGGIFGNVAAAVITNSHRLAGIAASPNNLGGLVGRAIGTVEIHNSHNHGTFSNTGANQPRGVGGIVGRVTATGNVTINGSINHSSINTAFNAGNYGGIVGRTQGRLTIHNAQNLAAYIRGNNDGGTGTALRFGAGGIVGRANNSVIRIYDTTNNARIDGRPRDGGIGGIIGFADGGGSTTLTRVTNTGVVHAQERMRHRAGGLAGWMRNPITIEGSTNTGNLTNAQGTGTGRNQQFGGLIARADHNTVINNSQNYGDIITDTGRTPRGLGGLIGEHRGRLTITNSYNRGDLGSTITSGQATNTPIGWGGIVGRSDMGGTGAANRVVTMTNVTNFGRVGAATGNVPRNVGGIIGRTVNRTRANYTLNNVVNHGAIRGNTTVGGIIGLNDTPNVTINNSANHGTVSSAVVASSLGGIVARSTRANLIIRNTFNTGSVTPGGTGNAALGQAYGGLVGMITAGVVIIERSFNAGSITGTNQNTGGIVGRSNGRRQLTIRDVYNIGTVTMPRGTSATNLRSGNGILGHRGGGPVRMYNVFNAGRTQGRPIYGQATIAPGANGGNIGTYMRFENVFFDTTVHTGIMQRQHLRGTLQGVPTDLLTRGILPGIDGLNWLSGTAPLTEGETVLNTYPYLYWQTNAPGTPIGNRVLETRFVFAITDINNNAVMDLPGAGSRTTYFAMIPDRLEGSRFFLPYAGAAQHMTPIPTAHATVTFTRTGPMSLGAISDNWVVGFDDSDRSAVAIRAVDEINNVPITHARFTVNGVPVAATETFGGIILIEIDDIGAVPQFLGITAFGYHPIENRLLTMEEIVTPALLIEIPMQRAPIDNIRVVLRDDYPDAPVNNRVLASTAATAGQNSRLRHDRTTPAYPNYVPVQGGNTANRHFFLPTVYLFDTMQPAADWFLYRPDGTFVLTYQDFLRNAAGTELTGSGTAADPWVVNIYLEDVGVDRRVLRVIEIQPVDDAEGYAIVTIPHGGGTHVQVETRNPEGFAGPAPVVATVGTANLWNIDFGTVDTQVRVHAAGYRSSEWLYIEDQLDVNEETGVVANTFPVVLDREIRFTIQVYEDFVLERDEYGQPTNTYRRPIPGATLFLAEDWLGGLYQAIAPTGPGLFTNVRAIEGEEIIVSVSGFASEHHTVDWLADVVEGAETHPDRPTGQPAPGFTTTSPRDAWSSFNIVLEREAGNYLTGFVRSTAAGNPVIPYAQVTLITVGGYARTTQASAGGFFEFANLPSGDFALYASHPQFQTNVPIPLTFVGEGMHRNIYLDPGTTNQHLLYVRVMDRATPANPIVASSVLYGILGLEPVNLDEGLWSVNLNSRAAGLITASATGFVTGTTLASEHDEGWPNHVFAVISLARVVPDFRVYVVDDQGVPLSTAELTMTTETVTDLPITRDPAPPFGRFTVTTDETAVFTASAPGFGPITEAITNAHIAAGFMTIQLTQRVPVPMTVRVVYDSTGEPIPHATLQRRPHGSTVHSDVLGNDTGVFTVNLTVGDRLVGGATGLNPVPHDPVTSADLAAGVITIRLTERVPFDNFIVRVIDPNGDLIPHAQLSASRNSVTPVPGMTITPGTGTNAGRFVADGVELGDTFNATAVGFDPNTGAVTIENFNPTTGAGTLNITLQPVVDPIEVTVEVRALNGGGIITTASLTHNGQPVLTGANGVFTLELTGANVMPPPDVLVASALGFDTSAERAIVYTDLVSQLIVIYLDAGIDTPPVTVTVEVREGTATGPLITSAQLLHGNVQVPGNDTGVFTLQLTGANIGNRLNASASGFGGNHHYIVDGDIVNGHTIVIVLQRGDYTLTITNTPATLTHNNQILTAGTDTLVVGSANAVQFG